MLASGIGFWWFAMVYVDQIVLGIALFEAFHDVQYLAIVWLYNCRRVNTTADVGAFMRFLFRRGHGLLWLYVGLVFAYGLIGIVARPLQNQSLKEALNGLVWASTILHFYYDGFIWKIRESTTRAALGLGEGSSASRLPRIAWGELGHVLKWCPLVGLLSWLTAAELSGSSMPPDATEHRFWPHATQFERAQNIAAAVPGDLRAQRRAAITLANFDRQEEAIRFLRSLLERYPDYAEGHQIMGEIHQLRGALDEAATSYRIALRLAKRQDEQTLLHHRLGEIHQQRQHYADAEREFREALQLNPGFEPSLVALKRTKDALRRSP
jgi:tetratricopeptide (TPR) repeat protein